MRSKKPVLFAILLLIPLFALGASDYGSDYRQESMGFTGASVSGNTGSNFRNPASLFFHDGSDSFTFDFGIRDTYYESKDVPFPFLPGGDLRARYAGSNVSVGISLETILEDREESENGGRYYDSDHVLDVDACFAVGWKYFSAGLGISASSIWSRDNLFIKDDNRIIDLFLNMVAENYTRVNGSESVNIRMGFQGNYENYTFGFLMPSVFSYFLSKIHFNMLDMLKESQVGLSYRGNRYSGRARLQSLVLDGAVEVHNIGYEERTLNAGFEVTLQIMSDYTVSLRAGYEAPFISLGEGIVTVGLGSLLRNVNINILSEWKIGDYRYIRYGLTAGMIL